MQFKIPVYITVPNEIREGENICLEKEMSKQYERSEGKKS